MADELFDVRNALTLGNYHNALAEGGNARTASRKMDEMEAFDNEKKALLARAQVGLGQVDAVIAELRNSTAPALVAAREWAQFVGSVQRHPPTAGEEPHEEVRAALEALLRDTDTVAAAHTQRAINAASALLHVGDGAAALTLGKRWLAALPPPQGAAATRQRVELHALCAEALLRRNRVELARAEVAAMEKVDDEALLTLLYTGIVSMAEAQRSPRPELYQNALTFFSDVAMRAGGSQSVWLLNLQAVAHMALGDNEKARTCLMDALANRSGDPETLSNLAVLAARADTDTDAADRAIKQAAATPSTWSHAYAAEQTKLEAAMAAFAARAGGDNSEWF